MDEKKDPNGTGEVELLPNQVMLFGQAHTLKPLVGRKARLVFPKVLDLIGAALAALTSSGISMERLTAGQVTLQDIAVVVMTLGKFLTSEQWERFETDLLPFLLQVEPAVLESQGDIVEVYYAAYQAARYHVQVSMDKPQVNALRKLFAEGQRRKNS